MKKDKIIVIYGFDNAAQKHKLFERVKEFYGLKDKEVYFHGIDLTYSVCLSYRQVKPVCGNSYNVISLQEFADLYNAAIPLTDWLEGKPKHVGEYVASVMLDDTARRYWNGKNWSCAFSPESPQAHKDRTSSYQAFSGHKHIKYRGLSKKPIILEQK